VVRKDTWYVAHLKFLDLYYDLTFLCFFCFGVLALELRAFTFPLYQSCLVMGFFEIGSHKLFAWAGFEPRSS
jgi:hypothetical protein